MGRPRTYARTCPMIDILRATRQWAAPVRWGCQLRCARWGAHWQYNLANMTKPSVCGGHAALCQIALTTCYYCDLGQNAATRSPLTACLCIIHIRQSLRRFMSHCCDHRNINILHYRVSGFSGCNARTIDVNVLRFFYSRHVWKFLERFFFNFYQFFSV